MKQLKKELQAISKALSQLTKKTEQMTKRLERLEKSSKAKKPKSARRGPGRPPKKTVRRKSSGTTAIEAVLKLINRSKKGVSIDDLRKKTGIGENADIGKSHHTAPQQVIPELGDLDPPQ